MRGATGEGSAGASQAAGSSPAGSRTPESLDAVAVLSSLAESVSRGLSGTDASALLGVAERARAVSAWLASVELEAVSRLLREQTREAREETGSQAVNAEQNGWDWTVAEVACAFRLTAAQADGRLNLAVALRGLPQVHGLLRAGLIDEYRARVIAETLDASALTPTDPAWAEVVDLVCAKAPERTHTQVRRQVNRLLLKIDPHAAARRRSKAMAGREVRWWAEPDGMATLQAKLSGETAAIIDTALSAMADAARDHTHEPGSLVAATHQERRADALGEVFRSILEGRALQVVPTTAGPDTTAAESETCINDPATDAADAAADGPKVPAWWKPPTLPTRKGRRPHLILTISERTLNGDDDNPAELAGYGPIPAEIGRQIARRAGTRTTVHLPRPGPKLPRPSRAAPGDRGSSKGPQRKAGCAETGCGTDQYSPDQALIDAVVATYPTCQAPGCTRAAIHCDLDHVIPHRHGGRTCTHNLRPMCRRHHRLKTHAGWRRQPAVDGKHPPGTTIWTTRLGRRYAVPPPDRPGSPEW